LPKETKKGAFGGNISLAEGIERIKKNLKEKIMKNLLDQQDKLVE
jgi:hypothetical protein